MSIKRSFNFLSQMRVDVPHLKQIESGVANDFDTLAKGLVGDKSYVVTGLQLVSPSLGVTAESLVVKVGGSTIWHKQGSEAGTFYTIPTEEGNLALSATNSRLQGGFVKGSVNYLGIDFLKAPDSTTNDFVKFISRETSTEYTESVPLARTLQYRLILSTQSFTRQSFVLPLAKITVDASGNITSIKDAREMMFRLGDGGDSPNNLATYPWGSRTEYGNDVSVSVNPFLSEDKQISSLKGWMDSVMTSIWELRGGEAWYSNVNRDNVKLAYGQPTQRNNDNFEFYESLVIGPYNAAAGTCTVTVTGGNNKIAAGSIISVTATGALTPGNYTVLTSSAYRFTFDSSQTTSGDLTIVNTLSWSGLEILFENSPEFKNTVKAMARPIAPGECLYVDLVRESQAEVIPQIADLTAVSSSVIPGRRLILAWRSGNQIFTRDRAYEAGRGVNIIAAQSDVTGAVRLSRDLNGDEATIHGDLNNPVVISSLGGEIDATATAATDKIGLKVTGKGDATGLWAVSNAWEAIKGDSVDGWGVVGNSTTATGVEGNSDSSIGVGGYSNLGYAVRGASISGVGVYGTSSSNIAIEGVSALNTGIQGTSNATGGYGIYGVANAGAGARGIFGSSTAGYGVWGDSTNLIGVRGSSTNLIGGVFTGGGVSAPAFTTEKYALAAYGGSGYASIYAESSGNAPGAIVKGSGNGEGIVAYAGNNVTGQYGVFGHGRPFGSSITGATSVGVYGFGYGGAGVLGEGGPGTDTTGIQGRGTGTGAGVYGIGGFGGSGSGKGGIFQAGYGAGAVTSGIEVFARAGTAGSLGVAGGQSSLSAALWGANGGAGFNGSGAVDGTDGGGAFQIASWNGGNGGNGGTYDTPGQQAGIGGQGGFGFFVAAGNGGSGGYGVSGGGAAGNKNGGNGGQAINAIGGNGGYADSGATTGSGGAAIWAKGGIAGALGGVGTIKGEDSPAILAYGGGWAGGVGNDTGNAFAIKAYGSGTGGGVYGQAGEASASNAGVEGYASLTDGRGVYGYANSGSSAKGVEGSSTTGYGVKGTGAVYGVHGTATAGNGGDFTGTNLGVLSTGPIGLSAVGTSGATNSQKIGIQSYGNLELQNGNPASTTAFTNTLNASNIPKAWAVITWASGTPVVASGFNISGISVPSGGQIQLAFAGAISGTPCVTGIAGPSFFTIHPTGVAGRFSVLTSGSLIDFAATSGSAYIVVFGNQ